MQLKHSFSPLPGLSFSSADLSLPLSVSGAALMVWSLFIFPTVQTALGAWMCAVTGLAVTVLLSVALGCTSFLAAAGLSHTAVLTALLAVMVLKVCAQQMCFPTSMVRHSLLVLPARTIDMLNDCVTKLLRRKAPNSPLSHET